MLRIKTISELKERLPEVVDRINTLKIYFDTATMMLKDIQQWTADGVDDYWGSLKAYAETLKNQMDYYAEIEYLQGLINKYCK
jgi:hypothetical protein